MEYISNTSDQQKEMLGLIGVGDVEELLREIPKEVRLQNRLNLPDPLTELELQREIPLLAARNKNVGNTLSFLGGGAYDHYIPAPISHLIFRSEFYTAYTPYQAEMSQGFLQSIYEYQTLVSELTGMEVANASLYDGASALAEAAWMSTRVTKRTGITYAGTIHPHYQQVLKTYFRGFPSSLTLLPQSDGVIQTGAVEKKITEKTAAVLVQTPNFFGCLEEVSVLSERARQVGALLVVMVDPISLGILKSPGEYGADIVVGEGQALGNVLNFGGPYLGFFATRREFIRQMPGRIVGATVDTQGRTGYCLTLQTREQHIRRERSTSNICTNEALNALAATIYLVLLGKKGLREVATQSLQKAHYAQKRVCGIDGFQLAFGRPFFKEFVVRSPVPLKRLARKMEKDGILVGLDLEKLGRGFKRHLLMCVTEKRTREEIDRMVDGLRNCL